MPFRVVVIGGGPIGLLSAIEAGEYFSNVTVVEKRSKYTRMNAPVLSDDIRRYFKKLRIQKKAGIGKDAHGIAPFQKIEQALEGYARSIGVKMFRPYVVSRISGQGPLQGGRYKKANLSIAKCDDNGEVLVDNGTTLLLKADLIIVASGAGAARDEVLETLGFEWERLKAKDYGAYAIFGEPQGATLDFDIKLRQEGQRQVRKIARKHLALDLATGQYLLATLSGIPPKDVKALQSSTNKLKEVMGTIQRAAATTVRAIETADKSTGVFKISIQQARQVVSPTYPAILVGDAAVTPHPEKGTGLVTGFRGIEILRDMLRALKDAIQPPWYRRWSPWEPDDTIVIYQTFNRDYKLHILRKALEGTVTVLDSNAQLLIDYVDDVEKTTAGLPVSDSMRDRIRQHIYGRSDLSKAKELIVALRAQVKVAKTYGEYLDSPSRMRYDLYLADVKVRDLWTWIAKTQKEFKEFVREMESLEENLQLARDLLEGTTQQ